MGTKEISTDDWLGDICNDEVPSINLSAQHQFQTAGAVGFDGCSVSGYQTLIALAGPVGASGWNDAECGTRVHKEVPVRIVVEHVEEGVTRGLYAGFSVNAVRSIGSAIVRRLPLT